MNLIKKLEQHRFTHEKGVFGPAPQAGAPLFFFLLTTYFWSLIGVNLLFLLCCLPIITIPASLCALNRYCIKMVREGVGFFFDDYWKEWKNQLLHSLPAGILTALLLGYGYYLLSISLSEHGSRGVFTIGLFWILSGFLFGSYLFVLLAMLGLPFRELLRNTLILMFAEWKISLCVLAVTVFSLVSGWILFPYSALVFLVCGYAVIQLAVCCMINPAVQKRIIGPYEAQQKKAQEQDNCPDTITIS